MANRRPPIIFMLPYFFTLGKSLFLVAILLLNMLFVFSVITFAVYHEEFTDPENGLFCQNMEECFVTVLRYGLIDSFLVKC